MVDVQTQAEVEDVARGRILANLSAIRYSLDQITRGNPYGAERSKDRRLRRVRAKTGLSRDAAASVVDSLERLSGAKNRRADPAAMAEAIRGTIDFVGVNFFEKGRRAADAVGRVIFLNGRAQGSGFLVAPDLFLTNHHVIQTAQDAANLCVQFDYETDISGEPRQPTSFLFDPVHCFVTDGVKGLDFTLIAVGQRRAGSAALDRFGHISLSDANDKHMLGETANLIQHPDGRLKELVLRENHLVARDETRDVLHYVADTEKGSSGSPVFNNEWQAIALHHWGVPWKEVVGIAGNPLAREVNEGIRVSAIVRHLRGLVGKAGTPGAVSEALTIWDETSESAKPISTPHSDARSAATSKTADGTMGHRDSSPRVNDNGSITWTFPIEITVSSPLAGSARQSKQQAQSQQMKTAPSAEGKSWKQEEFDDRSGYEAGFIPGFIVPLPDYSNVDWQPALNQLAGAQDDPHELRYHHFSIVMNADRRLCGFTAVNIDGARIKAINREDKTVTDEPSLKDLGVESMLFEGAEASDDFRPDRRILEDEQMNRPFYEKQVVAGFSDATSKDRIARIFQKGHIILRGDPAWGTETEAVAAERDTFFYTNAAPQVGFFNQGSALNRPGSKGKLRWRAVETYVLRNAVTMRRRVSVFAGPVFAGDDPDYRFDSQVPMKFWKIAVWNEGSMLRSVALLADQKAVIDVMPENMGPEAFGDEDELARVSEFVTTVLEIERLTKLDFGTVVRDGDIRSGESAKTIPLGSLAVDDLFRKPRKRKA